MIESVCDLGPADGIHSGGPGILIRFDVKVPLQERNMQQDRIFFLSSLYFCMLDYHFLKDTLITRLFRIHVTGYGKSPISAKSFNFVLDSVKELRLSGFCCFLCYCGYFPACPVEKDLLFPFLPKTERKNCVGIMLEFMSIWAMAHCWLVSGSIGHTRHVASKTNMLRFIIIFFFISFYSGYLISDCSEKRNYLLENIFLSSQQIWQIELNRGGEAMKYGLCTELLRQSRVHIYNHGEICWYPSTKREKKNPLKWFEILLKKQKIHTVLFIFYLTQYFISQTKMVRTIMLGLWTRYSPTAILALSSWANCFSCPGFEECLLQAAYFIFP